MCLASLPLGGVDPITGTALPPEPGEVAFYQSMFNLYRNTAGTPVAVSSCPLDASGALLAGTQTSGNLFNGSGCANQRQESLNNSDSENLIVVKIDHTIDANNTVWYRFQQDTGLQAAYTDPINPIFNSYSPQPQRTLVAGYTHVFRSNLVNQFNPGASWYSSIFEPNNFAQVEQTFPIVLAAGSNDAPFTTIGGNDNTYPQGRKVTQWQINDNLDWTRGKNAYRFGINTRRIDVSDYDLGEGTVPTAVYNDLAEFTYGAAYTESATFPISLKERVAAGNLDLYAMDTYKPTARATFTAGLRATWNTDPVNQQRLFARPAGSFLDLSHSVSQPLDQAIETKVRALFPSTPLLVWQPRVSGAYQVAHGLVVHAGFGVFNDIIPAQIADLAATNAPYAPTFVGGIGGQVGGVAIAPGVANSAADAASNANRQFQSAFSSGAPPCAGIAPGAPTCPLAVSLNTFPTGTLKTPYYYQYNLGIEQQLGAHGAVRIDYVGTRGLHEPFQVGLNGYQTVCAGCFAPYPYQQPLDQRFGSVNEFRTDASSNYSGLQTSVSEQLHGLTFRANYTLSHCLDEVSNGGLLAFSTAGHSVAAARRIEPAVRKLRLRRAPEHLGLRHLSNSICLLSRAAARALPRLVALGDGVPSHRPSVLLCSASPTRRMATASFKLAGRSLRGAFPASRSIKRPHSPASPWREPGSGSIQMPLFRLSIPPPARAPEAIQPPTASSATQAATPCAGRTSLTQTSTSRANSPCREHASLRFDAQMFNAFNHPNFALPSSVEAGVPGEYIPPKFGTLESTISPPTGLLGVGLGGDSSPRMIAFQARIEF